MSRASIGSNAGSLGDLQRAFQDYLLVTSDAFEAAVRDTKKADRITLLGGGGGGGGGMAAGGARPQRNAGAGAGSGGGGDHEPMGEPISDLTDDDIPF